MPQRLPMTEARLKALEAPTDRPLVIYDTKTPSLVLRWRPGGKPRWYVVKRAGGRMAWVALGEISDWPTVSVELARKLAADVLAKLADGKDPVKAKAERRAKARGGRVPILEALERHLAKRAELGRTSQHVAELERVVKAAHAAGVKDLADPGCASKAEKWLDALEVSDLTRHRYRVHLIAVGKTAVRKWPADVLPREPFLALSGQGAPLPPPPVFTPPECVSIVSDAALARVEDGGPLWAFLLYSGCRYREAAFARWDRIDFDRATFSVIPPTQDERDAGEAVKRGKARTVTLQPELVALLRGWRDEDEEFVFPAVWRTLAQHHRDNVAAFRRQLVALEIPLASRRIHSLRHAHACLAIASGEDSLRLRLSMGHAGEQMAAHYATAAMRWRGVLNAWRGVFRLRDEAEVKRLTQVAAKAVAS